MDARTRGADSVSGDGRTAPPARTAAQENRKKAHGRSPAIRAARPAPEQGEQCADGRTGPNGATGPQGKSAPPEETEPPREKPGEHAGPSAPAGEKGRGNAEPACPGHPAPVRETARRHPEGETGPETCPAGFRRRKAGKDKARSRKMRERGPDCPWDPFGRTCRRPVPFLKPETEGLCGRPCAAEKALASGSAFVAAGAFGRYTPEGLPSPPCGAFGKRPRDAPRERGTAQTRPAERTGRSKRTEADGLRGERTKTGRRQGPPVPDSPTGEDGTKRPPRREPPAGVFPPEQKPSGHRPRRTEAA